MTKKYFNFNNEADLTPVEVDDETGRVTFTMGEETSGFESLQEFAEFYAVARNVVPENLKNWVLTEDGNQFAFVLRAGTAGLDAEALSAMVASLRDAGMNPEEIGRAVAASQTNDVSESEDTSVPEPVVSNTAPTNKHKLTKEILDTIPPFQITLLKEHYNFDSYEDLIKYIAEQEKFFYVENPEYEEDDEGYPANGEDEFLFADEAFVYVLNTILDSIIANYAQQYPKLPIELAYDIDNNQIGENAVSNHELTKALFAAKMAHRRGVEVRTVTLIDDDEADSNFKVKPQLITTLADKYNVYKDNRKYFIIAYPSH